MQTPVVTMKGLMLFWMSSARSWTYSAFSGTTPFGPLYGGTSSPGYRPEWGFRNLPRPNSPGNLGYTMNCEASLESEISAVPFTCLGSGMSNKVPNSVFCKNSQGLSALPGYLFSRNLQKLPSCLVKAPSGDLCSMWLTLPVDSEEIWEKEGGRSWGEDIWAHTEKDWLIESISFSGNRGKVWLQQHKSFRGHSPKPFAAGSTDPPAWGQEGKMARFSWYEGG